MNNRDTTPDGRHLPATQRPTLPALSTIPEDAAAHRIFPPAAAIDWEGVGVRWAYNHRPALRVAPDPAQRLARAERRLAKRAAMMARAGIAVDLRTRAGKAYRALRNDVERCRAELEMFRFAKTYGEPRRLLPATLDRIRAGMAEFARTVCDCASAPIPGVFYDPATGDVQRCDSCRVFPGDLEAAAVLATVYGATVRFFAEGDDIDDPGQARTYNLAAGFDGMIAESTSPWVEPRVVPASTTLTGWAVDRG